MTKPATRRAVKAKVPKAAQRKSGMPSIAVFGASGISGPHFLEIERRWPKLTEAERQKVIARVYPHMNATLEELLK